MNVQRGLERMSAVWWGFWGGLAALFALAMVGKGSWSEAGAAAGCAIAAYVAHRLSCWIVAGFFSPRS